MREMRWNCLTQGCFRKLCPKLGVFDDCFPGKIGMSDIDGFAEINGRFLFMEWKAEGGCLQTGQRIAFERLTELSPKITVIVVSGDSADMSVNTVQVIEKGKLKDKEPSVLSELKQRVAAWVRRALSAKRRNAA